MEDHQNSLDHHDTIYTNSFVVPSPLSEYVFPEQSEVAKPEATARQGTWDLEKTDVREIKRAQNRAAQRAFRERKEAKLRALEQELERSEEHRKLLTQQLEELQKASLSTKRTLLEESGPLQVTDRAGITFSFPSEDENDHHESLHQIGQYHSDFMKEQSPYYDASGQQILTISATWDYLYKLSESQDFNIPTVLKQLKGKEVCHRIGAAYPKVIIDEIVQQQTFKSSDCV